MMILKYDELHLQLDTFKFFFPSNLIFVENQIF